MPSNQAKAIPQHEWNQHKDEIIDLFLTGKMETLRDGMEERGFSVTYRESQYEAQLKKWGIRKNGTKEDWKSISRLVRAREREGKRTDVYMYGKHVPTNKVKKRISRYLTASEMNNFAQGPHPQIPDGFSVETPKEETSLHFPSIEVENTLPIRQIMTANLPSSILEQFFVSRGCSFTLGDPHELEYIDPKILSTHISCPNREQVSAMIDTGTNLYNNALHLISEFRYGTFSNLHPLVSTLRSLLPIVTLRDLDGYPNSNLDREFMNSALTRLVISTTANNFPGLNSLPHSILECMRNPTNLRSLQELQSIKGPEAEALAENFFYAAVESSNAGIVEYLLRTSGLDPNKLVCNRDGRRTTPIERAVELGSKEVTRVLIHAKADPNKTLREPHQVLKGALETAINVWGLKHNRNSYTVDLELIRILLEAGAILNPESFESLFIRNWHPVALTRIDASSAPLLVTFYFNASATRSIARRLLKLFLRTGRDCQNEMRTRSQLNVIWDIIIGIVQTDPTNAIDIFAKDRENINAVLDIAAEKGHIELVKAFLRPGTIPTTDLLSRGIKSGSEELVAYLLDAGADARGHASISAVNGTNLDDYDDDDDVFLTRRYTTPLAEAIRLGNVRILELLQSRGAWLQVEQKSRFKAVLTAASEIGDVRLVRELLDMGSILDGRELLGILLASTRAHREEIGMMILESGAVAIWSKEKESLKSRQSLKRDEESLIKKALSHASRVGYINIVRKLLDLMSTFGERHLSDPLLASIEGNHKQVALMLLDAGADPSSKCIAAALNIKSFELVHLFLEADPNLRYDYLSSCDILSHPKKCSLQLLTVRAINSGIYSIVERLIAHGANVDEFCLKHKSETALIVAVKKQDIKLAQLLLDSGANVNICVGSITPLTAAVIQRDVTMTEFLLTRGANAADSRALHESMLRSDSLMEKLLKAFTKQYPHGKKGFSLKMLDGAINVGKFDSIPQILLLPIDLNEFDTASEYGGGCTPLGSAIMKDQGKLLDIVRMFLEAGGDPNSIASHQEIYERGQRVTILKTALLAAVETGNLLIVHLLVDHRAKVNHPATMGVKRTPLQKAAEIGSFDIVEYLLSKGAEINAPPARSGGATALQLAAIGGYIGIAELLLNLGADPNAPASKVNGRTAIEGAAEYGRVDMLRLLTNAGAKMDRRQLERAMYLAERNGHMATKKYVMSLFHETVSVEEILS